MGELPTQRPVIAVCRSGHRSARAARFLAGHGLGAANLKGGMSAWAAAGLPVVARGGRPGRIT
jgi:rhodanese-related sulfurtransferase